MTHLRTVGIAIFSLFLAITVASCNRADDTAASSQTPAKKMRIGISIPAADHGWTAGIAWWANRAKGLHPEIEWQMQTAHTGQEQVEQIQTMMTNGIDGLVVLPQDVEPVTQIAKQAHDRGIYIVNVDRALTAPVADVHLEGDNKAFGRKSAEFMVDQMHGKGNLVILRGIPCAVDGDRVDAAKAVFAQHAEIKIVAEQPAFWNREKALAAMQVILTANPHIDAVWAQDDDSLLGAVQAIKEAGRQNEMWVLGGAGMKDVIKMVMDKDPMVPADITYPPSMIAAGIHLAASALRDGKQTDVGQFMPKHLTQDVDLVTPDNAKGFYFPDSVY
jgi:ribose transport system substrate-binding protein